MIKCLQETASLESQDDEDADGLEACRGLRSAVIIEALAVGLVWAGWQIMPRLAAWWREW